MATGAIFREGLRRSGYFRCLHKKSKDDTEIKFDTPNKNVRWQEWQLLEGSRSPCAYCAITYFLIRVTQKPTGRRDEPALIFRV